MSARAALRIGLVGFGRLARTHYVPALRTSPWPLHIAVADPAVQSLAAARRQLPAASFYEDHRHLLAAETVDALLVASPPSAHMPVWRDACALQLPVFMEKPFPLSHELHAIEPSAPSSARLMIDFNRRFWPPYRQIAARVRAGNVGAVEMVRLRLLVDPRAWSTVSDHRSRPGEGGALHDLGSQILDLAAMIVGEAPQHLRITQPRPSEGETYRIELDFPNGGVAHCEFGYSARGEESVRVQGARGALRIDNPNFAVHRLRGTGAGMNVIRRGIDLATLGYRGLFRSRSMMRYSVREALYCFLHSVTGGTRFAPGIDDALRVAGWLAMAEQALAGSADLPLADSPVRAA